MQEDPVSSPDGPGCVGAPVREEAPTYLVPVLAMVGVLGLVWFWLAPGIRPGIGLILAFVTVGLAHGRGFNTWCWMFAGGPLGILALLLVPPVGAAGGSGDGGERRRRAAGMLGALVSSANVLWLAWLLPVPGR